MYVCVVCLFVCTCSHHSPQVCRWSVGLEAAAVFNAVTLKNQ